MLFILVLEYNNPKTLGQLGFGGKILASLFQSVTLRTAGFNTIDLAAMRENSIFFMIILMFYRCISGIDRWRGKNYYNSYININCKVIYIRKTRYRSM